MDDLAQEDHTYKATKKEFDRYRSHWTLQLNDLTFNGPMALRADYKAAVSLNNHMYRRPEDYQKPSASQYQDRQRRGCKFSEKISSRSQHWVDILAKFVVIFIWWQSDKWDEWHYTGSSNMVKNMARYEEFQIVRCPRILWTHIQWNENEQDRRNPVPVEFSIAMQRW